MSPRAEFSAKTKQAAWERCGGRCEGWVTETLANGFGPHTAIRLCNAPLEHGCFHYDHIDPDYFSRGNEVENCQVLCRPCHAAKTKGDIKNIAKSKRIQRKRIHAKKSKQSFPTNRNGKFRKKMDGTIERR